jgi:hypothetical protein
MDTQSKINLLIHVSKVGHAFALAFYNEELRAAYEKMAKSKTSLDKAIILLEDFDDDIYEEMQLARDNRLESLDKVVSEVEETIEVIKSDEPVMGTGTDDNLKSLGIKTSYPLATLHQNLISRYNLSN